MLGFRLFHFGARSNRISGSEEFHAESDEEAIVFAEARQTTNAMELWRESRKVKRWEVSPN
jgi:hypothetical protein